MEDLKQIQEFFLNENVFVEAFKLEKALKGMGYNVKVKYLDDFGKDIFEIYFNNPADADDDSIFYDAKKLGYDNIRVFANPQESVSEGKAEAWAEYQKKHSVTDKTIKVAKKDFEKEWEAGVDESLDEVDRYSGFNRNPEDPDFEPFNPTGAVAEFREDLRALFGKFKGDLKNPEFIQGVAQIMVSWKALLRSQLEEADLNDPVAMKMRAAKMKADKLAKMRAANAGDDGNDKFFEKSTARLRKLKALKDKRAQIMRDMEQEAELEGGPVADKYGDMLNKLDKAISMLGSQLNEYDVSMPSQEEVDQFFEKETHLQTHYLNAKPVMGQEGSFNKTEVQPWDEYDLSNWKALVKKSLKEVKKGHGEKVSKEVFAKLKGKTISYKGEDYKVADVDDATLKLQDEKGKYKTINFNQFNIDGLIREIMETIELGKQLEEGKLCKKGEAYRKRRMAAGEKSSAYLSGRAVKVCKGQMSGKKKK